MPLTKVHKDTNNVAPRLGFVWSPTDDRKLAIRASAGIFYDQNHFNYNDTDINQTIEAATGALEVYARAIEAGSTKGLLVGRPVAPAIREFAEPRRLRPGFSTERGSAA